MPSFRCSSYESQIVKTSIDRPPNTRVQRARSSPSALREPLTRRPLGARIVITAFALVILSHVGGGADRHSSEKLIKDYEAAHPGVLRVGGDVTQPKVTRRVEPNWESIPREKRVQRGPIIAEAVIGVDGTVLDPIVVSEPQPNLDPVFLAALRQWRYEPGRKAGRAVAVFLVVTVTF